MRRLPNWRGRFREAIRAAQSRPFGWGSHDCALWADAVVEALTGQSLRPLFPGDYDTLAGGLRILRDAGYADHEALVADRFPEITVARAMLGDLAVVDSDGAPALVAFGGPRMVLGVSPTVGLQAAPVTAVRRAFRVG